jgi:hypothetical protein
VPCAFTAHFNSDTVLDLEDAEGAALIGARPGGGYTAASFRTKLITLIDDVAATVTVVEGVEPEYGWTITVTGGDASVLNGARVIYEDGFYESGAVFVRTGDCD